MLPKQDSVFFCVRQLTDVRFLQTNSFKVCSTTDLNQRLMNENRILLRTVCTFAIHAKCKQGLLKTQTLC